MTSKATHTFKTPAAPAEVEAAAVLVSLKDGARCPTCGRLYGSQWAGFRSPCGHLVAHFGPFGWERTPRTGGSVVGCIDDARAFNIVGLLARQGHRLMKVACDDGEGGVDHDWLVWTKPAVAMTQAA